jgi:NAD(P)-dependent dehydrogenase (short-subunit alcohol dehydrogenase family)
VARTALVTGGNRGIGLETCRQLAESGMRVVLAARDPEKGEDAARKLREGGWMSLPNSSTLPTRRASRIASGGLEIPTPR